MRVKRFYFWLLPLIAFILAGTPARADTATATQALFSAKSVADRDSAIEELENADPQDPLVPYALGAAGFFRSLENLATALNRHGFESPQSFMLPLLRLPVPPRAEPEPLTYEGFRAILVEFRDGMEAAAAQLDTVPAGADIGVVADLTKLGIDLDGDAAIAPTESFAAIMAAMSGRGADPSTPAPDLVFRFDRADGYWLQGYANFLVAQADFWLAHDFQNAFDGSFHMFFPRSGLPLQQALVPTPEDAQSSIFMSEWRLADFVSFIHLVNWPVVEPERRQAARLKLLEMIRLSREDWKAIRAETDNDREWLPGPQQKGVNPLTGLEVGEEQVAAWLDALQMAEDLLEGRVLLPHFRIPTKGINMKAFFDAPQTFDLVLAITGPGMVPYLENGTLITAEDFSRIRQQFGGAGFLSFALWFN
ncbi:hypothetical protein SAMN04488498_106102 [Mesorhizobium albiziae]|uniref:EF-hand domain-containing protein n=1 Tax=Neomesorhizobium albiziae TaxID=335020 RepID=A0A1I3ZDI9_9HYPH|nr:hypothetical protein GCM10007937_38680 [Mesorhizobium albiziae]SFK41970.1 hypothetical protein SAMN04488498_106102 [Mesorhizobium albiziae]